jgi:hypothetical protein
VASCEGNDTDLLQERKDSFCLLFFTFLISNTVLLIRLSSSEFFFFNHFNLPKACIFLASFPGIHFKNIRVMTRFSQQYRVGFPALAAGF